MPNKSYVKSYRTTTEIWLRNIEKAVPMVSLIYGIWPKYPKRIFPWGDGKN